MFRPKHAAWLATALAAMALGGAGVAIAAGGSGKVDLVWLGTSAGSPDDSGAQWHVFFGQSKKAFASPSKWSITNPLTVQPDTSEKLSPDAPAPALVPLSSMSGDPAKPG